MFWRHFGRAPIIHLSLLVTGADPCAYDCVLVHLCVKAAEVYMQVQSVSVCQTRGVHPRTLSGFGDVHFTGAAAIGGCCDDVLCGGLRIGCLLLQLFSVSLG